MRFDFTQFLPALAAFPKADAYPIQVPVNDPSGVIEVQAHRGGTGMRTENSLWAFAYAMEIGVNTLEMDTVFTKDGIPVVWHEHDIQADKCSGPYVGQFIANLTLAQVKTMDCSLQLEEFPQAETRPGTLIPTLEEALELIKCYGDDTVTINLETKLDPTRPNETLPVSNYITDLIPILQKHNMTSRTTFQSFDWRTIIAIKNIHPDIVTVALIDDLTTTPDSSGIFPWLGGVNVTAFGGDWVAAAASTGATILGPLHGNPCNETVNTPDYIPFTTREVVDRAHELGMKVLPWTVDHEATINKMLDDGVDGLISNYPERAMWIARQRGLEIGLSRGTVRIRPECLVGASTSSVNS